MVNSLNVWWHIFQPRKLDVINNVCNSNTQIIVTAKSQNLDGLLLNADKTGR